MRLTEQLGMLASVLVTVLAASSAQAQSCEATSNCPKGYLCSVVSVVSGCASNGSGAATSSSGTATSGATIPAAGGVAWQTAAGGSGATFAAAGGATYAVAGGASKTMPVPVGGSAGVSCGTVQVKQCVASPCTADSECSVGWSCKTDAYSTCPTAPATNGGASAIGIPAAAGVGNAGFVAAGGSASDVAMPVGGSSAVVCTTVSQSTCQPNAQGPCTVADDCGPGYDCVEQTSCGCSGSASVGSSSGTAGAANYMMPYPGTGGSGATAPACTCSSTGVKGCQAQTIACLADADCPETWSCVGVGDPTAAVTATCQPPYTYFNGGTVTTGNGKGEAGTAGTSTVGAVDHSGVGGGTSAPAAPVANEDASSTSGGCQIGTGKGSHFAAMLLGAVALLGIQRRRRPVIRA